MIKYINVKSRLRNEFIDITDKIQDLIAEAGVNSGTCHIYIPHTTAGITINEGADPSVQHDIQIALTRLIPVEGDYHHREGNADAHIKASIVGSSKTLFVEDGRLVLGRWQSIYFCEFDGPRHRRVAVKIVSG